MEASDSAKSLRRVKKGTTTMHRARRTKTKANVAEILKTQKRLELGLKKLKGLFKEIPYHPECPDIPHIYR
jgi:hypothetical protein